MKSSIEPENRNPECTPANLNNSNVQQNVAPATTMVPLQYRTSFDNLSPDVRAHLTQLADLPNNRQFACVSKLFLNASQRAAIRQMLEQHYSLNEEIQLFIENAENIYKHYPKNVFSCQYYIKLLKPLKNDYSLNALKLKEKLLNELNNRMGSYLINDLSKSYRSSLNGKLILHWSGCYLTRLPSNNSFIDYSSVEFWDLSNNKLSSIPQIIWGSENLKYLDITGNLFKDLPANSRDILYCKIINANREIKTTKLTEEQCLRMQKNAIVNENTSNNDQTIPSPRNPQPKQ